MTAVAVRNDGDGPVQPQTRGVDRLFRLFQEDQLLTMRVALEDCDSATPRGPRPIVFANAQPECIDFDRAHAPLCILSFDIPARVAAMTADNVVRSPPNLKCHVRHSL